MHHLFEKPAAKFAETVGASWAIGLALLVPLCWFVSLFFRRDQDMLGLDRSTIVEFANMFMFIHLFLMQRSQNKNVKALHLKVDELIASKDGAHNDLIKAERAPEDVIDDLHSRYEHLAEVKKNSTAAVAIEEPA